jgi:molecular chaperone DnaK (HSP70)
LISLVTFVHWLTNMTIIGIDLGTTNSLVAGMTADGPMCFAN